MTDASGAPVTDGGVSVLTPEGENLAYGTLDENGDYAIRADVPAGTVVVQVSPYESTNLVRAYYGDVALLADATRIPVAEGEQLDGIDVTVGKGAKLRVTLTGPDGAPAPRVSVELVGDGYGDRDLDSIGGWTDSEGTDLISRLRPGKAKIAFARASADTAYVPQWFLPATRTVLSPASTVPVTLSAGGTKVVNATLQTGAQITGVVRNGDGTPAAGQTLVAFVDDGSLVSRSAVSGADGSYTIKGLLPGRYFVAAAFSSPNYGDTFYGAAAKPSTPNVKVTGKLTTSGVDITVKPRYTDVLPSTRFAADIEWLAVQGIDEGTLHPDGTSTFDTEGVVRRGDLAVLMFRAEGSPEVTLPETSPYTDVAVDDPRYAAVVWADSTGILPATVSGTTRSFKPTVNLTRHVAASALYRLAGSPAFTPPAVSPYSDVLPSHTAYTAITWLESLGVTRAYVNADGTTQFQPSRVLRRGPVAEMLHLAAEA